MITTSIIIPTYNRSIFTRVCVQSLLATLGNRADVEVVFVDNGSVDGTPDYLRGLPAPFRAILNRTNRGFAAACNQGAEAARGQNVLFLNNDTVPLPGWLCPLESLLSRPDVGIAGSKLLFPDDTIQHAGVVISQSLSPAHIYYLFPRDYPSANIERDYQAVTGACLAIRRSVFFELGGMDEIYRNSFEDIDLCLRTRILGYRVVYCPQSVLYHFESVSEGRFANDDANRARFMERWQGSLVPDELDWYRKEGFTTVPHLPTRTLAQTVAQLESERLRTDNLTRMVCLLSTPAAQASPGEGAPNGATGEMGAISTVPAVVTAGTEILADVFIVGKQRLWSEGTTLRYSWQLAATHTTVWTGEAAHLEAEGNAVVRAHVLAPSVPALYDLIWTSVNGAGERTIAHQPVSVAPRWDYKCWTRLTGESKTGDIIRFMVALKNTGAESWPVHGRLALSYHWFDETGRHLVEWEGLRSPIRQRLAHGEETLIEATVVTPLVPGRYQLVWDIVLEGEFWFSYLGVPGPATLVDVEPRSPKKRPAGSAQRAAPEDHYLAEIGRKERRVQELEKALKTEHASISSLQQTIAALEHDRQMRDQEIRRLEQLVEAIMRGRVMRLMIAFGRWRQRTFGGKR